MRDSRDIIKQKLMGEQISVCELGYYKIHNMKMDWLEPA